MSPIFWVQKQDIGPSPRTSHAMAYDAARGRVIVFGGDPGGPPLGDTWEWDGDLWTQVADIGPAPRHGSSLTDHAQSQRVVLFGGSSGATLFGDTWTWDGTDWVQVADTGPQARSGHAAAYDRNRQRIVLFGGDSAGPLGDTWEWYGTEWTQVQDAGPSARRGHSMAFDAAAQRVILFGGAGADGTGLDDTWAWDGSNWTQVADTGPDGRVAASIAGTSSLLLFGGVNSIDPALAASKRTFFGDTWAWTSQGWTKVQDIGPGARYGHGAAARSVAPNRVVVLGGTSVFAAGEDPALVPGLRNDTWEVPEAAASVPQPQPPVPPPPPPPPPPTTTTTPQVVSLAVQPMQLPAFQLVGSLTVTMTTNVAPPAGSSPTITVGRFINGVLSPTTGFIVPPVTFNGITMVTTFVMNRDGTPMQAGMYGVSVSIGGLPKIAQFQLV